MDALFSIVSIKVCSPLRQDHAHANVSGREQGSFACHEHSEQILPFQLSWCMKHHSSMGSVHSLTPSSANELFFHKFRLRNGEKQAF